MLYIFIDESGDFGHKKGSENIVVACLATRDYGRIKNLMRKERDKRPRRYQHLSELKASDSSRVHRTYILKNLASLDLTISYSRFQTNLYERKFWDGCEGKLYALLVREALSGVGKIDDDEVYIILDRRQLQGLRYDLFDNFLLEGLSKTRPSKTRFIILHVQSDNSPGLMAVDYVSYAIFRNYEHGDISLMDIIEARIVH